MRGSPPLHLVLFVVGFALLAIPLAQLTFARPAQIASIATEAPTAKIPTSIHLRFAHPPKSVSLKENSGPELLKKSEGPLPTEIEAQAALEIPKDGIELTLEVTWPEGTPDTAVTVELVPNEKDAQSQTRWSSGSSMSEILNYEWKP